MRISKGIVLYIVWLMVLCMACEPKKSADTFSQAAGLLWSNPDSAVKVLQAIPHPERLREKERADYALLLSHAYYRSYSPKFSDSLVNIAFDYYHDNSDIDKKAQVWYLKGCVEEDVHKEWEAAIKAYKNAEKHAPVIKDKKLAIQIYSCLGYLNNQSHNYQLARDYYKKSLLLDKVLQDTAGMVSNIVNLSKCYAIMHDEDSSKWSIDQLVALSECVTDSSLKSALYNNIGVWNQDHGNKGKAEAYLEKSLEYAVGEYPYRTWSSLAKLYMEKGNEALADSLYRKAMATLNTATRATIYLNRYREAAKEENYKKATEYANSYIAIADTFYNDKNRVEILKIQKEYDALEARYQAEHLKVWNTRIILGGIILLLVIARAFLWYKQRMKRKREKLDEQVNILTEENEELDMRVSALILDKENLNIANNKMRVLLKMEGNKLPTDDEIKGLLLYYHLCKSREYDPAKNREVLARWLDVTRNGFAAKLSKTYPQITGKQIDVCYLYVSGFDKEEISELMKVDIRTVDRYMQKICQVTHCDTPKHGGFTDFMGILKKL